MSLMAYTWRHTHHGTLFPKDEVYERRAELLEQEVRNLLVDEKLQQLSLLKVIDNIQRLGLAHRFGKDIIGTLQGFDSTPMSNRLHEMNEKFALRATALRFRLLRQHGFPITEDVFEQFKDKSGNYKQCLSKDVQGMLDLYEASHLSFEGENLLDEARDFTRMHLQNYLLSQESNKVKSLEIHVSRSLELPLHRRMLRLEARYTIEEHKKRKTTNRVLLELAKLDFNLVQSVHQKDLKEMSRWWREIGLANKLSFARDRLMECFFWSVGIVPDPRFSECRRVLTKVASFITVIDDIYDVHGSLEELELFTDVVKRWDVNAIDNLPDYMKLTFLALYNAVNEMAYQTLREKGVNSIPFLRQAWEEMCKAFLVEAKWLQKGEKPTFKEYMKNAWISVSGVVQLVHAYFLVSPRITKEALDCLNNHHDILRLPSMIFRFSNDLSTSQAEMKRGEMAKSIPCLMQEMGSSGDSFKSACQLIRNSIDDNWEGLNEIQVHATPFSAEFIETSKNLARIAQCTYQYGDGHGAPDDTARNRVFSLLVHRVH